MYDNFKSSMINQQILNFIHINFATFSPKAEEKLKKKEKTT